VKVVLLLDDQRHALAPGENYGEATIACPHCAHAPLQVQGTGKRPSEDDRAYEADAVSVCCSRPVGLIRAEVSTLFGVREDRAVLMGRCRVY